jgi:hypothetical protein
VNSVLPGSGVRVVILGSGELGDPGEDGVGRFLNLGRFVETEDRSMVRPNECAGEEKELVARGETLPVLGQAGWNATRL